MNKILMILILGIVFVSAPQLNIFAQNESKENLQIANEENQSEKKEDIDEEKIDVAPDTNAQDARMKEYMTPNDNHGVLKKMEGAWKTKVTFWMSPDSEGEVSEGTSDNRVIFGGRFIEQSYRGEMMGQDFEGRGILGYDNLRQEFVSVWFDNMATGIMQSKLKYHAASNSMDEEGDMSCPITNEAHRPFTGKITFKDDNHYEYETYMKDRSGKEYKAMQIKYTRE